MAISTRRTNFSGLAENPVLAAILERGKASTRTAQEGQLIANLNKGGGNNRPPPPLRPIVQKSPGMLQSLGDEISSFATDLGNAKKMGREYKARDAIAEIIQPKVVGEPGVDQMNMTEAAPMVMPPSAQDLFKTSMLFADTPTGAKGMQYARMLQGQQNIEQNRNIAAQTRAYERDYREKRNTITDNQKQASLDASRKIPIRSQDELDVVTGGGTIFDPNRSYYTQGGVLKTNKLTDLKSPARQQQDLETSLLKGGGGPNKGTNEAWKETAKKVSAANVETVSEWQSFEPDNEIRLTDIRAQIDSGGLNTGPGESIKNTFTELGLSIGNIAGINEDVVKNFIGRAKVDNYEEANKFTKNIFNLVNKQLRQENGVQAKDDFDRFFKELPNINDPIETVKVMTDYLVNVEKLKKFRANYVADAKADHRAKGGSPFDPTHQDKIVQDWRKKITQMSLLGFQKNPEDPKKYDRVYLMDYIDENVPEEFSNNPTKWPRYDALLKEWNTNYVRARKR